MTLSSNRGAYQDCYKLLEQALATQRGIRVLCKDYTEAHLLRLRLNKARLLNAEANRRTFEPEHPLYNTSEFYILTIKVEFEEGRQRWLCILEKKQHSMIEVEEIPDDGKGDAVEFPWMAKIEDEPDKQEEEFDVDTFDLPEGSVDPSPEGGKGSGRRF